ncbi:hypothetical protein O5470_22500 [Escherichia coli]|nr:hypothetical protein [Escherichia coli]
MKAPLGAFLLSV